MPQDRSTGAAADRWGRETARLIAFQIGATMQRRGSNEALLNGQKVAIKCAAAATDRPPEPAPMTQRSGVSTSSIVA